METSLIEFIELRLVDINGKIRGMTVPLTKPVSELSDIKNDENIKNGINVDGSSLPGFASIQNSDLHLEPDFSTLIEIPYLKKRKAAVLCFLYNKKDGKLGSPFLGDARSLLNSTIKELFPGLTIKIKPEPEFHIVDDNKELVPHDNGDYISVSPDDASADIMMEFASLLRGQGMNVKYYHHEVGPSQQEIELNFTEILKNLDDLITMKLTLKTVALQHGLSLIFMPKPMAKQAGNGLHFHIQVWDKDKNIFADEQNDEISDYARHFIAGILEHAPAITAVANPSINSYKRLVPGYEAPVYITWGHRNRSVLLRVPMFQSPDKAAVEIRSADFTTNPYLLMTVLLAAGNDGLKRKLEPPAPRTEDVFEMTEEERRAAGIKTLPSNLGEALDLLKKDALILNAMGPHLGPAWLKLKGKDWQEYNNLVVTDYELEKYKDC